MKHQLRIESSIFQGGKNTTLPYNYDFTNAPQKEKWFFENHKEIKNDQLKLNFLEDIKTQSSGIYNATSVVDRKNIADAYSYI